MRRVFQAQFVCRRVRRTQLIIKLPVFKACSYLYNNFVCWDCAPQLYLGKKQPVCHRLALLGFFLMCKNIFWIFDQFRFFLLLGEALIFWLMCLRIALYSLFGQPELCLIFILSKITIFSLEFYSKCLLHLLPWRNLI